jgi:hypothetical protein
MSTCRKSWVWEAGHKETPRFLTVVGDFAVLLKLHAGQMASEGTGGGPSHWGQWQDDQVHPGVSEIQGLSIALK